MKRTLVLLGIIILIALGLFFSTLRNVEKETPVLSPISSQPTIVR